MKFILQFLGNQFIYTGLYLHYRRHVISR